MTARAFKMSKSRGNVINPDDVVHRFGADSLRLYEMFMGPLRDTKVDVHLLSLLHLHTSAPDCEAHKASAARQSPKLSALWAMR